MKFAMYASNQLLRFGKILLILRLNILNGYVQIEQVTPLFKNHVHYTVSLSWWVIVCACVCQQNLYAEVALYKKDKPERFTPHSTGRSVIELKKPAFRFRLFCSACAKMKNAEKSLFYDSNES